MFSPTKPLRVVLWDMDGTLTDSAPAILPAMQTTLARRLGIDCPQSDLMRFIGPPLSYTFKQFAPDADSHQIASLVSTYRQEYRRHVNKTQLFPGIIETVALLYADGIKQGIATAKLESNAKTIAGDLGISGYMGVIAGSDEDETHATKAEIIGRALRSLDADAQSSVMVGDRIHDIEGANANQLGTIIVTWAGTTQPGEAQQAWQKVGNTQQLNYLLGTLC
ncbi:MAG: HAD hydrolase-like protein [Actinomycetaceae bacterium]|nr:HAD hydrolase-like protein [Actinomycetaceae bacterium]